MSNRLCKSEHTSRPWHIHDLVPDFRTEDVWAFKTPHAEHDDFPLMLDALRIAGGPDQQGWATRLLFSIRWKLGEWLGWDESSEGVGSRVPSLSERLPADLRQAVTGTRVGNTPFVALYELPDECAYEMANRTVHDVLHLGWVKGQGGDYELRMAALVKPNGLFGRCYMAAIMPFRYLIVYPAMRRQWERAWLEHGLPKVTARSRSQAG